MTELVFLLSGKKPNTYTFTKALAEDILVKECGKIPVAIVRPSAVLCSLQEPMPGYVENMTGPNGLIAAGSKGIIRTMPGDGNMIADLVPVDTVINLMIVCAWWMQFNRFKHVAVYNCCTGTRNPITWGNFLATVFKYVYINPTSDLLWYPDIGFHHPLKSRVLSMITQRIPAFIIDRVLGLLGKNSTLIKIQNKLEKAKSCFEYFISRQWNFNDKNVQTLYSALSKEDQKIFDFDVKSIDWETYIESYVLGLRKFLLKEDFDTLAKSRSRLRKLYVLHIIVKVAAVYVLFMCLSTIVSLICHVELYIF